MQLQMYYINWKKITGQRDVHVGSKFSLLISNKDIDYIIEIVKPQ